MINVSILIPCRDEEKILASSYNKVKKIMDSLKTDYEIIIEQDGSTDKTLEIMEEIRKKDSRVRTFSFKEGKGLGWAWNFMFSKAKGQKIIMTDADMSVNPKIFPKLLKELEKNDIVIASRYKGEDKKIPMNRFLASRIYYALNRLLFGLKVKDSQSGFQAFKKEVVKSIELKSKGFEVNLELLVKAKKKRFVIKEIPVYYEHRDESKFSVLKHGPKTLLNTLKLFIEVNK
ncbi:MAG: glycosyltransferase family 2 protein [Nanoarchaeota archaeon]|nr:glycosyltransferase family 2 protein [Nanoarchaeota archaeon]